MQTVRSSSCMPLIIITKCVGLIRARFTGHHHRTHRAMYVRAGRPLAVGRGRSRTSDFLLLAQQVAVLLLSVLHVDQQRDEAVLHLVSDTTPVCSCWFHIQIYVLHLFIHTQWHKLFFIYCQILTRIHMTKLHCKNEAANDSLTFLTDLCYAVSTAVCSHCTTDVQIVLLSKTVFNI